MNYDVCSSSKKSHIKKKAMSLQSHNQRNELDGDRNMISSTLLLSHVVNLLIQCTTAMKATSICGSPSLIYAQRFAKIPSAPEVVKAPPSSRFKSDT